MSMTHQPVTAADLSHLPCSTDGDVECGDLPYETQLPEELALECDLQDDVHVVHRRLPLYPEVHAANSVAAQLFGARAYARANALAEGYVS